MPTLELRICALPGHVRTARIVAASLARRCRLPAATVDEVKLAVGEACARAVMVHVRVAPDLPVLLRLTDDDGELCIEVADSGGSGALAGEPAATGPTRLDPEELDPDDFDPEELGRGGLGLALIAGLVDDVDIEARDGGPGTLVRMRWQTRTPAVLADADV